MKIFIVGGNGLVGKSLTEELLRHGHQVTAMGRSIRHEEMPEGTEIIQGDAALPGTWQDAVPLHDAVVNLAGVTIFHRWSKSYKELIGKSRLETTGRIVEAVGDPESRVQVLINASAVGYYGSTGDRELSEDAPRGNDFLARVCGDWEKEAERAEETGIRVVRARFGIVMSERGGALVNLKKIFSWHLGAMLGTGNQWFSWIHLQDLARILVRLIEDENICGAVNCTSPMPVTNRSLTGKLGGVMEKSVRFPPVPSLFLRGALGEFSSVLLQGQRAVPSKLLEAGYDFLFPALTPALQDLLDK